MAEQDPVVIISGARTAIGRFGGGLASVEAIDLGAVALRGAIDRSGLEPSAIQRVVAGENIQVTPRGNPARQVLLRAGIPATSDDYAINMNCASGLRAMSTLASDLLLGDVEVGAAVGMENMSRTPYLLEGARWGYRLGNASTIDFLSDYILGDAGPMAETVAERCGIGRERQDAWAIRSQHRAAVAIADGRFSTDIVGVPIAGPKGTITTFETDEHPRPETTIERLAQLKPAFREGGTVTAGNSSGINDAGAAVVLTRLTTARRIGRQPRAVVSSWAAAGVEPGVFGLGPIPATRRLLERSGLDVDDLDIVELNEAFASSTIAVIDELGLDAERVNVNGGAIALGHPVGATGIVLVLKLLGEMERRDLRRGLVTMCVGNGQGMSMLLERPWAN
jgi:acetyl-CoA C-acetyltransferase